MKCQFELGRLKIWIHISMIESWNGPTSNFFLKLSSLELVAHVQHMLWWFFDGQNDFNLSLYRFIEMFGHGVYFLVFEHCSTFLRVNRIELATVVEEPWTES